MFTRFIGTILDIMSKRGMFDTTPENLVRAVLETLEGLVQADQAVTSGYIATTTEVVDLATVETAEAKTLHDIIPMLVEALNSLRLVKGATNHSEIPQGLSDELWRLADKAQGNIELAVDRVDPDELNGWLESKW